MGYVDFFMGLHMGRISDAEIPDLRGPYDEEHLEPQQGTKVRIWAGQHESSYDMAGNVPDVAVFAYDGRFIGVFHGNGRVIAAGGFVDINVINDPGKENIDPYYIRIFAGGDDGLCLSGFAMTIPSGGKYVWTADTVIQCKNYSMIHKLHDNDGNPRVGYSPSRTQIGVDATHMPQCLWLDRNRSHGLRMQGITLHISDLTATPEKQKAYADNLDLICRPTARQMPMVRSKLVPNALFSPAWIFNPPLTYNPNGTDTDPLVILNWEPTIANHAITGGGCNGCGGLPSWKGDNIQNTRRDPPLNNGIGKRGRIPAAARRKTALPLSQRRLIVSTSVISAQAKCDLDAPWDDADYLSLQEKIYCDTSLRTMYHMCDETHSHLCFDSQTNALRRFEGTRYQHTNMSDLKLSGLTGKFGVSLANLGAANNVDFVEGEGFVGAKAGVPAPLFGFSYGNVLTLS